MDACTIFKKRKKVNMAHIVTKNFTFDIDDNGFKFDDHYIKGDIKFKKSMDMNQLLKEPITNDDSWNYAFVNGIYNSPQEKELYEKYGLANGITVLNKGLLGKECRKNSGHYHGISEGNKYPKPEIYEIIYGKAAFLLQESKNFDKDEELQIDSFRVVYLNEGDKLVVPAYCAHCAINVGDDYMAFYNLAGISPLHYDPITKKHGFAYYVVKDNNHIKFEKNPNYKQVPNLIEAKTTCCDELGIIEGKTVYETFEKCPDRFGYLNYPDKYEEKIEELIVERK